MFFPLPLGSKANHSTFRTAYVASTLHFAVHNFLAFQDLGFSVPKPLAKPIIPQYLAIVNKIHKKPLKKFCKRKGGVTTTTSPIIKNRGRVYHRATLWAFTRQKMAFNGFNYSLDIYYIILFTYLYSAILRLATFSLLSAFTTLHERDTLRQPTRHQRTRATKNNLHNLQFIYDFIRGKNAVINFLFYYIYHLFILFYYIIAQFYYIYIIRLYYIFIILL